jgi:NADPH2:quinone reductase
MNTITKSGVVRINKQGSPSVLEYTTEQVPQPSGTEVLIKQEAIAVNFVDVLFRNGSFPLRQVPATIGVEAAGVVEAVGAAITDWKVGDRVAYYFSPGAYASRRVIRQEELVKLPDDITFDTAAALLAKGLTARMLVKQAYAVQSGDVVLVHAAAGGVGSLVSRWAKALGATVIGTVGSAAKKARAAELEIDHIIALDSENLVDAVNDYTKGKGVKAVFDGVGKATFAGSVEVLQPGGAIVLYGTASGEPQIDAALLATKQIQLLRPALMQYLPDRNAVNTAAGELFQAFRSGVMGNVKTTVYPLAQAGKVHQELESGHTTGSLILHP